MGKRRHTLTFGQKVMLWCGVLLNIWLLIQIPSVFDALLTFFAAGVIPGTTISLSPDTVLQLLVVVSLLLAALFVYTTFIRSGGRDVAMQRVIAPVEPLPTSRVIVSAHDLPPAVPRTALLMASIKAVSTRLAQRLNPYARLLIAQVKRFGVWLGDWGLKLSALAIVLGGQLWEWVRPFIRQFDTWIERRLKAYAPTATALNVGSDVSRTLQEAWHKALELSGAIQARLRQRE